METRNSPWRKRLDIAFTTAGLILSAMVWISCFVKSRGGPQSPMTEAVSLWCFLCLLARLGMLILGGSSAKRRRILVLLCALFTLPCASIALMKSSGNHSDPRAACIHNLRQLMGAKEVWALENNRKPGTATKWVDIVGADGCMKTRPECPTGGMYTLGNVEQPPRCSLEAEGHVLPPGQ